MLSAAIAAARMSPPTKFPGGDASEDESATLMTGVFQRVGIVNELFVYCTVYAEAVRNERGALGQKIAARQTELISKREEARRSKCVIEEIYLVGVYLRTYARAILRDGDFSCPIR